MRLESFHPHEPVALYIHIPFCTTKCDYCAFFSLAAPRPETVSAVLEATAREGHETLSRLNRPLVRTVYIGGGSPSILSPAQIQRLGEAVMLASGQGNFEEWTVEANPETLTPQWLEAVAQLPVTRVSVGVQSFSGTLVEAQRLPARFLQLRRHIVVARALPLLL